MPIIKNVLGYPDQRVVEQACLAVVRIVDSYRHHPDKLESLLTSDLLVAIRALLNPDSTTIGPRTYTQILKMLSTASKASPEVAIALVELNIARTLYHLLAGISAPDFPSDIGPQVLVRETPGEDMLIMQNLVQRPKEQIQETLALLCELLPPLPKGLYCSPAHCFLLIAHLVSFDRWYIRFSSILRKGTIEEQSQARRNYTGSFSSSTTSNSFDK